MFESVDGLMDGRRLESHTISSPWAFGSGELKIACGVGWTMDTALDSFLLY